MSSLAKAFFLYLLHALIRRTLVYGVNNAVTLSCHASHMSVQVDLKYFRWLDPQSLHLRHHSCSSNNYTKTSASKFFVPLYGCGTRRRTHENLLIYTNAVSNSNRNFSFISRVPYVRMPFYCVYRRRYSLLLRTGTASKTHVTKKTKKPQQEGIVLEENNGAVNLTDSSPGSLHGISTSILWATFIGVVLLV